MKIVDRNKIVLYQTLEDRDNPDDIESKGPFICRRNNAWLGIGYYFWDTHIELAHWWGTHSYLNGNGYVICRADGKLDDYCWDLHSVGAHREEFKAIVSKMQNLSLLTRTSGRVADVIEYMKKEKLFPYNAIRAFGIDSVSQKYATLGAFFRMFYQPDNKAYLDGCPSVQICLINKNSLSLRNYKIVFPDHYVEDDIGELI